MVPEALILRPAGRLQRKELPSIWCRRRDLNPHGLRHTPLKRACLPFHHFGTLAHDGCLSVHSTSPDRLGWARRNARFRQSVEGKRFIIEVG
jgi:hypothetical protein